jgi:hypothetical protein
MGKIFYAAVPCATELIDYINQGHLDYFLVLPYQAQELLTIIQQQVSRYTLKHQQRQLFPKNSIVDTARLLDKPELSKPSYFKEKFLDYSLYSDSGLSNLMIKSLHKV